MDTVKEAQHIKKGDKVELGDGQTYRIIHSGPETLSSSSAANSQWYMCAINDNLPTRNLVVSPNLEFTVVL